MQVIWTFARADWDADDDTYTLRVRVFIERELVPCFRAVLADSLGMNVQVSAGAAEPGHEATGEIVIFGLGPPWPDANELREKIAVACDEAVALFAAKQEEGERFIEALGRGG